MVSTLFLNLKSLYICLVPPKPIPLQIRRHNQLPRMPLRYLLKFQSLHPRTGNILRIRVESLRCSETRHFECQYLAARVFGSLTVLLFTV